MTYYEWFVGQSKEELAKTLSDMEDAITTKIMKRLYRQGVEIETVSCKSLQLKSYMDLLSENIVFSQK